MSQSLTFCPNCAAPIEYRIPPGDNRERAVCSATGEVFYVNPRNVVGCIVERDGAILMCRRAIEPRRGFWTVPAGFLELGETCFAGAARETVEEACAEVVDGSLFSMIDITHIGQIHMFYRAQMVGEYYAPGPESEEVRFVQEADIDWPQLAFPSIHHTLSHYFADRRRGHFALHDDALDAKSWRTFELDAEPMY